VKILALLALGGFVALAAATTLDAPFVILFGWIPFLARVLPEVQPDGPSAVVGAVALMLFGVGVHWLGRSWRGSSNPAGKWRIKWTAAVILGALLLFTAGISMIGLTHQVAWLATSEQPTVGVGVTRHGNAESRAREIGMDVSRDQDLFGHYPSGGTVSAKGELLHSWETQILSEIPYNTSEIDWKRPWNAPENQKYFKCVIPQFINPAYWTPPLEDGEGYGLSHYAINSRAFPIQVVSGEDSRGRVDLPGGTANTIFCGEVNEGFKPWGHPINGRDPAAGLNRGAMTFGGPPGRNGTLFVMADGSVRFIGNDADPDVLRALSDPRVKPPGPVK
jgi:hypothetical protein